MDEIEVVRGAQVWLARSEGFRSAFGTDTLPTAYGPHVAVDTVVRSLMALNPGTRVWTMLP